MSTQIPFYVLVGWNTNQEPHKKDEKAKLKISRSLLRTMTQWDSTERLLNSSGQIYQDFDIDYPSRDRERVGGKEHPTREGPDQLHINVQRHLWKSDDQNCILNAEKVKNYAKNFLPGHWTFWVQVRKGNDWYGSSFDGQWDRTANRMVQQFKETGHPIFTATSTLSRGILKQRRGKKYHSLQWRLCEIQNSCFNELTL